MPTSRRRPPLPLRCDRDAVVRALESGQLAGYAAMSGSPNPLRRASAEILECWFDGRPIREEYLIVQSPPRGSFGTTRLSLSKSLTMPGDSPVSAPAEEWFSTGFDSGTAADRPPRRKCAPDNRGDRGHIRALPHHEGRWKRRFPNSKRPERPPLSPTTWGRNSDTTSWDLTCSRAAWD